jgi:hypothetical protein
MRLLPVILTSALLLASGPVLAQHIALAPAKPECPPGEPDSLQISWTQPCDTGTWLLDTETGCRMWDWHPEPEDKVVWRGACHAGLPNGRGEAQWFEHGRPIDHFTGPYRNGKRDGEGRYMWNESVRFDGTYADDVPQGQGVLKLEGDTFAGEWKGGCFVAPDGRVVAIGVPRTSCGSDGGTARKKKVAGR